MGTQYSQLTYEERIAIHTLLKAKKSKPQIAALISRPVQTVRREISRNSGQRGYRPKQAQALAAARRAQPRTRKMTQPVVAHVEAKLREQWSPEQIAGTMQKDLGTAVSHERIYQHVWRDKAQGGALWRELRIAGGKRRRKRYGKKDWRGRIPNRVGIERRPKAVERRARLGDWELDLVSGARHQGFLLSCVERKSRFTLIGHVPRKNAAAVATEARRLLAPHEPRVRTLTFDNGREFAEHQTLAAALHCHTFFANPYHAWERGTNENTNGLIRQYFPKQRELKNVSAQELEHVMQRLNHRPRKTLGWKTPAQLFSRII